VIGLGSVSRPGGRLQLPGAMPCSWQHVARWTVRLSDDTSASTSKFSEYGHDTSIGPCSPRSGTPLSPAHAGPWACTRRARHADQCGCETRPVAAGGVGEGDVIAAPKNLLAGTPLSRIRPADAGQAPARRRLTSSDRDSPRSTSARSNTLSHLRTLCLWLCARQYALETGIGALPPASLASVLVADQPHSPGPATVLDANAPTSGPGLRFP
jgi:hypothetical protein